MSNNIQNIQNIQSMESYNGDNTEIDAKEIIQEEVHHVVCEQSPYVCGDQLDNNETSTPNDLQKSQSEHTIRSVHKSTSAESNRAEKNKRPGIPVLKKSKVKQDTQDSTSPPESHQRSRSHSRNVDSRSEIPRMIIPFDYKTESDVSYNESDVTDLSQRESPKLTSAWDTPKPLTVQKKKFERKFKSAIPTKGVEVKKPTVRKIERPTPEVQKRNIESQFNIKKKKLLLLKKEIEEKQKPLIDTYKALLELKKKSEQEGLDLVVDEIKIIAYEPIEPPQDKMNIDPKRVSELTLQVQNIPVRCIDICNILAKRRVTILDNIFNDRGEWSQDVVVKKVNMCKENIKKCEVQIQKRLKEEEKNIQTLISEWQNLMMTAGVDDSCIQNELTQKLEETEHKLKQTVDALQFEKSKKTKDMEKMKETERELSVMKSKVEDLTKNLKEEKSSSKSHQERYMSLEQKFKAAKNKIREIDAAKHDFENKIEQLKNNQKKIEADWKSKEIFYENRHKELLKSLKNAEQTIATLDKERHSVNCRADELEEELKQYDEKFIAMVNEKDQEIEQIKQELEELKLVNEQLVSKNENLKVQLIEKEGYDKSVVEILHSKHEMRGEIEISTELEHDLWRELSVARNQLEKANEKLETYALEKVRFIETMRRNKEGEPLKQLMEKENEISSLKIQNKQLQNANENNLLIIDELKVKLKVYEKQCAELSATNSITEEKDNGELLMIYQDKLKLALQEYENCESMVLDLRHRLHTVETGLKDHQKMIAERDSLLAKAQEKKNALALDNENLRNYVKHLRFQLAELNEEHSMKLAELQGTYCLLEEKTHYVTKLESTLQDIEQKQAMSKFKGSSRQTLIQQRSEFTISDISPLNMSVERRNRFLQKFNYEKHIEHIDKIQNKKFCLSDPKTSDSSLKHKKEPKIRNNEYLTDLIMNTLFYKENPQEFVMHAKNLASYELNHSKQNSNRTVHAASSLCCMESKLYKDFHDPRKNNSSKNFHVDLNLKLHGECNVKNFDLEI